ncbi:hypothetical protein LOAG_00243 [Loa loa]|nr:hypothetical protein LOAG_00243 [Loa loa]EFO28248.2 hypothetical protein LOAG_00243 [Loa loa]
MFPPLIFICLLEVVHWIGTYRTHSETISPLRLIIFGQVLVPGLNPYIEVCLAVPQHHPGVAASATNKVLTSGVLQEIFAALCPSLVLVR